MLTEAKRKWAVCMFHACPAPEIFLDPSNFDLAQEAIIWGVLNCRSVRPFESFTEFEQWAMQTYLTYPRELDDDLLLDFEPGAEVANYVSNLCKLHMDGIFAPSVVLDLLGGDQGIHPVLSILLLKGPSLPFKTQAKLAMTCKGFRDGFGYDPFTKGHRKIDQSTPGDTVVNQLALHAYQFVCSTIAPTLRTTRNRLEDTNVQKLSQSINYPTSSGHSNLYGSNCLAQTEDGSYAVNFLDSYNSLSSNKTLSLKKEDYLGRNSHVHAEIRHLEKQLNNGKRTFANVYIDKLCCTFCAIQYIVFGALDQTPGAKLHPSLQWYTFSPYVVYFRGNRARM